MKDKKATFKEQTVENITDTKLENVDLLEEVAKMPQYDDLLNTVPEEDHEKLQEALDAMAEPWQDLYDHIAAVLADKEKQRIFKQQCLERDWSRKDKSNI